MLKAFARWVPNSASLLVLAEDAIKAALADYQLKQQDDQPVVAQASN